MIYANIVYTLTLFTLLYLLARKKINLFQILIFVAPFQSWFFNIGLNLSIFKIFIIVIFISSLLSIAIGNKRNILNFKNKYIIIFLFYIIIITLYMSAFEIDDFLNYGGFFRSEGRFISQIILWVLSLSIIPLSYNYVKNYTDIIKYLKMYLYGLIFLVIIGWIQYFIYNTLGFDIFPIDFYDNGEPRTGIWTYMGSGVFRISSLGGEPKGLAQSLIIGFFIIQIANDQKINFFRYDLLLKYIFLVTVFATLSTSGFVLLTILLVIYYLYKILKGKLKIQFTIKKLIFSIFLLSLLSLLIVEKSDFFSSVFEERIASRDIGSEDYDAPIQLLLIKEPKYLLFGTGAGNVHDVATKYIPDKYKHYMMGTIFVAKSGYLKFISEFGLLGLFLFSLINLSVLKQLPISNVDKNSKFKYKVRNLMHYLMLIVFFALLARVYVFSQYLIILVLSINTIKLIKEENVD